MRPGVFAKTFANGSLETSLDRVARSGVTAIQFNLVLTGGPPLPDEVPPERAARVCEGVRARGLEMVAVSGTCNMAHADPRVRRANLRALSAVIAAAPALGTPVVTLCTGTRDPHDMWRRHPDNATPAAWADMVSSVAAATVVAERNGVVLAFEPEPGNVAADARAARRLLDEIGSPHLKVLIDAANLIQPQQLDRQGETLQRAFELLAGDLVLAHAKDVLEDGTVVPAGRGRLDYGLYVGLLRQAGYAGALVLQDVEPRHVAESAAFLRRHLGTPFAQPA